MLNQGEAVRSECPEPCLEKTKHLRNTSEPIVEHGGGGVTICLKRHLAETEAGSCDRTLRPSTVTNILVKVLEGSSQSPDQNLVEMLWWTFRELWRSKRPNILSSATSALCSVFQGDAQTFLHQGEEG